MNQHPLVSVIIPNYNHAKYLPARIESVLNQTWKNIEVFILDDCSPDNSREVIDEYAGLDNRIKVVYNQANSGSTFKQWNKGIGLARGKYIWIAESDDAAEDSFLSVLVSELEKDEEVVLAYCDSFDMDENNVVNGTITKYLTDLDPMWSQNFVAAGRPLIQRFMSFRNVIPNASAVVFRASTAAAAGPADESYRLFGDVIYWAKIISVGKIAYVSHALNYFRTHQNNARTTTYFDGTSLQENSRAIAVLRMYGEPDAEYRTKALELLLNKWYDTWAHQSMQWDKHMSIFKNVHAVEPGFAYKLIDVFARRFFYKAQGFRVLIGDKFLYKVFNNKS